MTVVENAELAQSYIVQPNDLPRAVCHDAGWY